MRGRVLAPVFLSVFTGVLSAQAPVGVLILAS